MTKTALAVFSALDTLGKSIEVLNMLAGLAAQTLRGNFAGGLAALQASIEAASASAAVATQRFNEMMDPAFNPLADPTRTQAVSDAVTNKITGPIIQSTTATKKASAATDEWGRKLDEAAVKKRATDLIIGAQEPWQQFETAIKKADADLVAFGATGEQISAVHQQIAEKYQNTWAQVAPAVAGVISADCTVVW